MNCPNCNNIIPDDSIFCPECGLQQRNITPAPKTPAFDETAPTPEKTAEITSFGSSFTPNAASTDAPAFSPYAAPVPTVKKEADASKDGFAVSSLVIGIISLIPFVGSIEFAIASLVFGIIGTKSTKKGVSIAGIVLSAIAILFTILMAILFVFILIGAITETYGAFDEFVREFENSIEYEYYY